MPVTTLATRIDSIDNAIRANVRTADGAGGTVALLNSDSARQIFNISVAKTLLLPTIGVKAGDPWTIENSGAAKLTIQASNASVITHIDSIYTFVYLTALQDAPTTAAHWRLNFVHAGSATYLHGTTYNGGIAPTITVTGGGALSSVDRSSFIPYQLQGGSWRLKIFFTASVASGARTFQRFSVNGVTFLDLINGQALVGIFNNTPPTPMNCYTENNSGAITIEHGSATTTRYIVAGEVELVSKPTWAY